uniref:Carbohydrate sulfotransferase 11 n=1 Tax=Ovis aries TaxID=9940 RepID=A0AC11D7B3_SHEEP
SSLWRGGRGPVRQPQRPAQRQRRRRRHHHQHHRSHPSRPAREEAAAAAGGSGGGGGGEARRSRGRSNGAQPAGPRISALPEQLRRLPHPCPGLGAPRAAAKPTPILPAILAQPCPAPPGLRSAPRGPRSCAPGAPPGHPGSRSQDKAMKPALLEVMRMNRICRMVLATCLGSFILVIFYFQSMLHPVMRRNPFGVDICCRKGSRSPLQELYNPTQSGSAILARGILNERNGLVECWTEL